MRWRLIVDGALRGALNMAVDEALVEAVDRGDSPPVLRLYRWEPACLSLGFAQPLAAADAAFCAANGVDLVRRPTGGRAVLHHLEQTYCVLARLGDGRFTTDLQAAYQGICTALVAGLRELGAPAGLAGVPAGGYIKPTEAIPCFVGPASGEVVAGGRKLIGSAMRRHNRSILQHGSLLEGWDSRLQAGCLGLLDDSSLRPVVTTLGELMGVTPDPARLVAALVGGFETTFGIAFEASSLTAAERARAAFLAAERYGHERWTVHRNRSLPSTEPSVG